MCPLQPNLGNICPIGTTRYIADAPAFASLQDRLILSASVTQWTHKLCTPNSNTRLPLLCFRELEHLHQPDNNGKLLGEGAFGKVFLAWCSTRGTYVAVKMYKRYGQPSPSRVRKIFEEALFYKEVERTDAAPQLVGLCALDRQQCQQHDYYPVGIVMEFIGDTATLGSTDLLNLCEAMYEPSKNPELRLSKRQCISLLIEVTKKLRSLHKINVIVNDIKLDNILIHRVHDRFIPYFIDFSHATLGSKINLKVEMNGRTVNKYLQDHKQIAPEWPLQGRVHRPTDVYAMGLMFMQIGQIWEIQELMQIGTMCRTYEPEHRPSPCQIICQLVEVHKKLSYSSYAVGLHKSTGMSE